jgi:DNA-binding CsgD family transcriptional regulator
MPLEDLVNDLETVVRQTVQEHLIVFALSVTAVIAVQFVISHPDITRALVLWNPSDAAEGAAQATLDLAASDWSTFRRGMAAMMWGTKDASLVHDLMSQAVTQDDFLTRFRALQDRSLFGLLPDVTVPALVLSSQGDTRGFRPEENSKRVASLIPGARLLVFDSTDGGLEGDGGPPRAVLAVQDFVSSLPRPGGKSDIPPLDGLSAREVEVLRLIAQGKTNPQIADALVISRSTVQNHVSSILNKTGLANRAEAAAYAQRHGLL